MSRKFTVNLAPTAITAEIDVFEIPVSASQMIRITSAHVGQISDAGDANAQMLQVGIRRGVGATSGSGGSTPTARPHDTTSAAFSGTIEAANTTVMVAGGGSVVVVLNESWNVQAGWYYQPTPEEYIEFLPSEKIAITIGDVGATFNGGADAAISNGITVIARCTFEVFGPA